MATIDLGKIKMVYRGAYNNGTAYTVDDVVQHTDSGLTSSFICTTNSTGNAPSTGGTVHGSWSYLAKGASGSVLTTQGDILYRDGSGDQRLPKGTANQILQINSGATAPEWTAKPSGSVPVVETFNNTAAFFSTTNQSHTDVTALDTAITPTAASSKILIMVHLDHANDTHHYQSQFRIQRKTGSGSFGQNVTNGYGAGDSQSSSRATRAEYDSNGGATMYGTFVDVPNTTDTVTYRIQVKNSSGGGTLYLNRNSSNSSNSNHWQRAYACKVIAMELKQ